MRSFLAFWMGGAGTYSLVDEATTIYIDSPRVTFGAGGGGYWFGDLWALPQYVYRFLHPGGE